MAMSFSFRVLENGSRNYFLQVNGIDAATTTAATTDGNTTGIIAANGYSGVTTSLKVRRIIYNTVNCTARLEWHATSNTDLVYLTGYGDWEMEKWGMANQGFINDKGAGATGDIDLFSYATNTVTGGAGLFTAAMSLVLFCTKGA
jgi:hypothetical protein